MDSYLVVTILAALAAAGLALEQVAVKRQMRAYELAAQRERDHAEYQKTLAAQLLKQIRDLENRIMAKDIQGYQILAATDEPPSRFGHLGRSDEDEALLQQVRASAQEKR